MGRHLNGLDLFSGIGGITIALQEWVMPVAYCEIDKYARAVLLSRMSEGQLPIAPIWDDVTTLRGDMLPEIDIIYGGFPCQDISVAGRGAGMEGKRSGLFFEIMRLVREVRPAFIFLENVPAIRNRGLDAVLKEVTDAGYDCRWTDLSASQVGAWHKRNRWWMLAYSDSSRLQETWAEQQAARSIEYREFSDSDREGLSNCLCGGYEQEHAEPCNDSVWSRWAVEPDVDRVVNGLSHRVDRIKGLGNAVVPLQAKTAFEYLMGVN
jgi:DNA (cytosine-5)-methyltransferase 1